MGRDAYREIDPYISYELVGLDRVTDSLRRFRDFFFDVAREEGVPLQPDVLTGYGEDGAEIQRYDTGRPSVNMTVPTRYRHSHTGMIQRSDFDQAVELLLAILRRLDDGTVEEISSFDPR